MATSGVAAITETEILEALATAAAGSAPGEAKTSAELAEAHSLTPQKVNRALKHYQKLGRLRHHRVQREAIDGTMRWVAAYTILPAKRK